MSYSLIPRRKVIAATPLSQHWIHSDLQLSNPAVAEKTMRRAVEDVLSLGLDLDSIWCLGDATTGAETETLKEVAEINIDLMALLQSTVYYVMGNHEMDTRRRGVKRNILFEMGQEAGWRTAALDEFYLIQEFNGFMVVFMGDHAAQDGSWWTTHGRPQGEAPYPYSNEDYLALREKIDAYPGAVLTASHYAFPGGQRPNSLLARLLPLPSNVRCHFYGNAHIGDMIWNRQIPWLRWNPITGDERGQLNISALEAARSPGSHSAFLEYFGEEGFRVKIRCHLKQDWIDEYYF